MIQAKDLRVGNWVQSDVPVLWQIKVGVGKPFQMDMRLFNQTSISHLHPIPLDEGWLITAGFEWAAGKRKSHLGVELYEKSWLYFYFNENGVMELTQLCDTSEIGQFDFPALQYVHQLQNLYYALTGTELEFKPK